MSALFDLRVAELMISRLCHDLVSPVSAINNGVELITEMGDEMGDEAMDLIAHSATQAARRLQIFRLAYGSAGADPMLGLADMVGAAQSYFQGSKITLDWDPKGRPDAAIDIPAGLSRTLLNVVLLVDEVMSHGGSIAVDWTSPTSATITGQGRTVEMRPDVSKALKGDVLTDDLTPRTIHAYVTGRFAETYRFSLTIRTETPGAIVIDLMAPR